MLSIDINHPQAEDFITAKNDKSKITGANISTKVDDKFMESIYRYDSLTNNKEEYKNKKIWDKLVYQSLTTAEPGVLFWDAIKRESIPSCYGEEWEEISTNPCKNYYNLVA